MPSRLVLCQIYVYYSTLITQQKTFITCIQRKVSLNVVPKLYFHDRSPGSMTADRLRMDLI